MNAHSGQLHRIPRQCYISFLCRFNLCTEQRAFSSGYCSQVVLCAQACDQLQCNQLATSPTHVLISNQPNTLHRDTLFQVVVHGISYYLSFSCFRVFRYQVHFAFAFGAVCFASRPCFLHPQAPASTQIFNNSDSMA